MDTSPHTVSDVMTRTVVAVSPDAPFKEVAQTLRQWGISAMPVLAGDGRVVGVISEADLLFKEEFRDSDTSAFERYRRLEELAKAGGLVARDLMSSPAVSVFASATLAQAARTMAVRHVKRLPVVDGEGRLAGIVSRADLLKVFLRPDEELAEEVRRQVVEPLFPHRKPAVGVRVEEGVVTFTGAFGDPALVPMATRMARAVEGVVDVRFDRGDIATARHTGQEPVGSAR
ncbi:MULTISPECIES: CBS domain-containing protein [unclassified Streptomyces]|uniref:CBS domain-containing protein n=1 Tax=unclassified Streptomyces TaxID=2593676 RepID=UPI0022B66162|nr:MULTISPECIES: CBS domain-containing protein [unclassified Streptomyces]MCZ7417742.1 CBS domain-containing protein [Streptomyces sp. WMMC897]MCZ7432462.1 CBS domain-containing protein [Streptomyces sp. WMMC1477]